MPLSKDEKHRLKAVTAAVNRDIKEGTILASEYNLETLQWLAVALQRLEDELKIYTDKPKPIREFYERNP